MDAKRVTHIRFNNLKDPAPVPKGTDYASVIISDVPIGFNIPVWIQDNPPTL